MRVIALKSLAAFLVVSTSTLCYAQCQWTQQLMTAIQRRYSTNEEACKALLAPTDQFHAAHAIMETQFLSGQPMVQAPNYENWLQQYSSRFFALVGHADESEAIHFKRSTEPNAFATGQNVTLHTGIMQWYIDPLKELQAVGMNPRQANQYLASIADYNPGRNGLIAVFAHETAHNVLGHPDYRPLAQACNDYINSGIRQINDYQQSVATGRKSRMGNFFRSLAAVSSGTLLAKQEQQQKESDADELGAWLTWKTTGDPFLMAKSLRWLSLYPGILPNSRGAAVSEVLCSDHPGMLARVSHASSVATSFQSTGVPRATLMQLPQDAVRARFIKFKDWYPARVAYIERLANGNLSPAERAKSMFVELEAKPSDANLLIDGKSLSVHKIRTQLALGPHVIAAESRGIVREQEIVVLEGGPNKFKVEAK